MFKKTEIGGRQTTPSSKMKTAAIIDPSVAAARIAKVMASLSSAEDEGASNIPHSDGPPIRVKKKKSKTSVPQDLIARLEECLALLGISHGFSIELCLNDYFQIIKEKSQRNGEPLDVLKLTTVILPFKKFDLKLIQASSKLSMNWEWRADSSMTLEEIEPVLDNLEFMDNARKDSKTCFLSLVKTDISSQNWEISQDQIMDWPVSNPPVAASRPVTEELASIPGGPGMRENNKIDQTSLSLQNLKMTHGKSRGFFLQTSADLPNVEGSLQTIEDECITIPNKTITEEPDETMLCASLPMSAEASVLFQPEVSITAAALVENIECEDVLKAALDAPSTEHDLRRQKVVLEQLNLPTQLNPTRPDCISENTCGTIEKVNRKSERRRRKSSVEGLRDVITVPNHDLLSKQKENCTNTNALSTSDDNLNSLSHVQGSDLGKLQEATLNILLQKGENTCATLEKVNRKRVSRRRKCSVESLEDITPMPRDDTVSPPKKNFTNTNVLSTSDDIFNSLSHSEGQDVGKPATRSKERGLEGQNMEQQYMDHVCQVIGEERSCNPPKATPYSRYLGTGDIKLKNLSVTLRRLPAEVLRQLKSNKAYTCQPETDPFHVEGQCQGLGLWSEKEKEGIPGKCLTTGPLKLSVDTDNSKGEEYEMGKKGTKRKRNEIAYCECSPKSFALEERDTKNNSICADKCGDNTKSNLRKDSTQKIKSPRKPHHPEKPQVNSKETRCYPKGGGISKRTKSSHKKLSKHQQKRRHSSDCNEKESHHSRENIIRSKDLLEKKLRHNKTLVKSGKKNSKRLKNSSTKRVELDKRQFDISAYLWGQKRLSSGRSTSRRSTSFKAMKLPKHSADKCPLASKKCSLKEVNETNSSKTLVDKSLNLKLPDAPSQDGTANHGKLSRLDYREGTGSNTALSDSPMPMDVLLRKDQSSTISAQDDSFEVFDRMVELNEDSLNEALEDVNISGFPSFVSFSSPTKRQSIQSIQPGTQESTEALSENVFAKISATPAASDNSQESISDDSEFIPDYVEYKCQNPVPRTDRASSMPEISCGGELPTCHDLQQGKMESQCISNWECDVSSSAISKTSGQGEVQPDSGSPSKTQIVTAVSPKRSPTPTDGSKLEESSSFVSKDEIEEGEITEDDPPVDNICRVEAFNSVETRIDLASKKFLSPLKREKRKKHKCRKTKFTVTTQDLPSEEGSSASDDDKCTKKTIPEEESFPTGTLFYKIGAQLYPVKRVNKEPENSGIERKNNATASSSMLDDSKLTKEVGEGPEILDRVTDITSLAGYQCAKSHLLQKHLTSQQSMLGDCDDLVSIYAPSEASFLNDPTQQSTYDELDALEEARDGHYENPFIVGGKLMVPERRPDAKVNVEKSTTNQDKAGASEHDLGKDISPVDNDGPSEHESVKNVSPAKNDGAAEQEFGKDISPVDNDGPSEHESVKDVSPAKNDGAAEQEFGNDVSPFQNEMASEQELGMDVSPVQNDCRFKQYPVSRLVGDKHTFAPLEARAHTIPSTEKLVVCPQTEVPSSQEIPPWIKKRRIKNKGHTPVIEVPPWEKKREGIKNTGATKEKKVDAAEVQIKLRDMVDKMDWKGFSSTYISLVSKADPREMLDVMGSVFIEKSQNRIIYFSDIMEHIMSNRELITPKIIKNISAMGVMLIIALCGIKLWSEAYIVVQELHHHHIPFILCGSSRNCPNYEVLYMTVEICLEANDESFALKLLKENGWLLPRFGEVKERQFRTRRLKVLNNLINILTKQLPNKPVHWDLFSILGTILRSYKEDVETVPEMANKQEIMNLINQLISFAQRNEDPKLALFIHKEIKKFDQFKNFNYSHEQWHDLLLFFYRCRNISPYWLDKAGELALEACMDPPLKIFPPQKFIDDTGNHGEVRISPSMSLDDIHIVIHGYMSKMSKCVFNIVQHEYNLQEYGLSLVLVNDDAISPTLRRPDSSWLDAHRDIKSVLSKRLLPAVTIKEATLNHFSLNGDSVAKHIKKQYEMISPTGQKKLCTPIAPNLQNAPAAESQCCREGNSPGVRTSQLRQMQTNQTHIMRSSPHHNILFPHCDQIRNLSDPKHQQSRNLSGAKHQQPSDVVMENHSLQGNQSSIYPPPVPVTLQGLSWPEQMMLCQGSHWEDGDSQLMPPPRTFPRHPDGRRSLRRRRPFSRDPSGRRNTPRGKKL